MSELIFKTFGFRSADSPRVPLRLRRYSVKGSNGPRKPVLLIHGASASHDTFTVTKKSLVHALIDCKFEPWLLDWRGSRRVTDRPHTKKRLLDFGKSFTFNGAAEFDIPGAIEVMRSIGGVSQPIAIMGHCMGAGILAESLALGHLEKVKVGVEIDCVVLSTLGLFYETAIDSRLKSEDRVLERLAGATQPIALIDPRVDNDLTPRFPGELETIYSNWPGRPFHEPKSVPPPNSPVNEMCNRLRFMYGMPYLHGRLSKEIHDVEPPKLASQFGGIPLHMYIHAARNIRQGHATSYDGTRGNDEFVSDRARSHFERLKKVTLITGELNRLWHRNSIDLMHEWLCRGGPSFAKRVHKKVFAEYGHQDLLWGDEADTCVFPIIAAGLRAQVESNATTDYGGDKASTASAQ